MSLTDDEFRSLAAELSEPAGEFKASDNLVSNELHLAEMVRLLGRRGGVYIGVGPEQNFSYIAEVQPALAFVVDVRQENRDLHLLYKALFELSADRADFVGRLFSRPRPQPSGAGVTVEQIFAALDTASADAALYETTQSQVHQHLQEYHRLALPAGDLRSIDEALAAFREDGPDIRYGRTRAGGDEPSYRVLMTRQDIMGHTGSYLSSEERFAFVKGLHARNLVVPVVGNFGGTHTLRRISEYVRRHDETVTAFYGSNVQVYLSNEQTATFCETLAGLPHTSDSWFIGSKGMQRFQEKLKAC
jgi:catechol 2,3-dioxygenase-like lactoylglutathione lyase family enzyme